MKLKPPTPATIIETSPNPLNMIALLSPEYEAIPRAMTEVINRIYPKSM